MEVSQTKGSWGSWSIFFQSEMKLLGGKSLFKEKVFRWQVGKGTPQEVRVDLPAPAYLPGHVSWAQAYL